VTDFGHFADLKSIDIRFAVEGKFVHFAYRARTALLPLPQGFPALTISACQ
jgi:hypothetical protein